jgi:hypothetical protein
MGKIKKYLFLYSFRISIFFFIISLSIVSGINFFHFPFKETPPIFAYFFWFSSGLVAGCYWVMKAFEYLKR